MKLLSGLMLSMLATPALAKEPVSAILFVQCDLPLTAMVIYNTGGYDGVVFGPMLSTEKFNAFQEQVLKVPQDGRNIVYLPGDCGQIEL